MNSFQSSLSHWSTACHRRWKSGNPLYRISQPLYHRASGRQGLSVFDPASAYV